MSEQRHRTRRHPSMEALALLATAALAMLCGCATKLAATPYIMQSADGRAIFDEVPEPLRSPDMPVLYITDRLKESEGPSGPRFGFGRSRSMSYGMATVSMSPEPDWPTLVADSTGPDRSREYELRVTKVEPHGEFTPLAELRTIRDGLLVDPDDFLQTLDGEASGLRTLIADRLRISGRKEVVLFVHGFNNTFDDGVIRIAQAWHLAGRLGVPIAYSWPAGSGLFGYGYDRESGEFTIVHLKRAITAISRTPGLERMHIVAHSRGTDVVMTALREINAEARGVVGKSPFRMLLPNAASGAAAGAGDHAVADMLKLETVVLAAPDLDVDVFAQRVYGENSLAAAQRTVIYYSGEDEALAFARWIFGSKRRLGLLANTDFTERERQYLDRLNNLEMVSCEVHGYTTHAYMFQHPAALSDMIRVLRDGSRPGAENGRPLKRPEGGGFWILDNSYMRPQP